MNILYYIIDHWHEFCAIALIVCVLVQCARYGVNCNIGDFPKKRR